MTGAAAYAAYDAAGLVLGLAAAPFLPLLRRTRYGHGLAERLGRVPPAARGLRNPVWVHAASVGEVLAAAALVEQLRQHWPDRHVLVSTTSLGGRETARTRLGADAVMLLPLDIGPVVERVMRAVQPRCLVLVETEIWPALIRAAARHRVPCVMVSGRISARAAIRYAWVRWLTRAAVAHVSAFAMQTDADAARIIALGAPPERVQVVGSLKFARAGAADSGSAHAVTSQVLVSGRPLLVAASTHAGEEQMVLDACMPLWSEHPEMLLLIAPRRPERFDEVSLLLAGAGVVSERRSAVRQAVARSTQVLLLDTLGELPNLLSTARAVFVGGTMVPVGGHNVLEPALFGKPVAFGPFTENVALAADALLDGAAGTRVHGAEELRAVWSRLLRCPEVAEQMGARGRAMVAARAAVAQRTFEMVRKCVEERT
ncbi:MAG: 3-deoxy-D-manno-octulosonic acid transferase [Candidatus Binatia bacterium]